MGASANHPVVTNRASQKKKKQKTEEGSESKGGKETVSRGINDAPSTRGGEETKGGDSGVRLEEGKEEVGKEEEGKGGDNKMKASMKRKMEDTGSNMGSNGMCLCYVYFIP